MENAVTKDDLRQFGMILKDEIRKMLKEYQTIKETEAEPEWIRSKRVRTLLDLSPGSIQNLRISGKIRYKKILGSYYYNREDISKLFSEANKGHG